MRIAVLGVGLIGGSIGLAAKRRLDAEVSGFDPDPAARERALERQTVDRMEDSIAGAVEGAEVVFCAAPVRALPELVSEALASSGEEAAVTDVGSTKGALVAEVRGRRRSASSAATRWPARRPPGWRTRAPTCSRARAGT